MAARIKPNPHIVNDRQQAEGALAEIASLDRKLESIEHSMQEAIDAAKMQASQSSAPLRPGAGNWRTLWPSSPG